MSFLGQDEQIREYQFRFRYLYIILGVVFFMLLLRLWYLQILKGDEFRRFSEENRIKRVKITSPRGMVFDRNKKLIVDNRPAFDLSITPQELFAAKDWQKIVAKIAEILKIPEDDLLRTVEKAKYLPSFMPVRIKQDLSETEVAVVEAHKLDFPGVSIDLDIKRTNLFRDLAAHLIGYISEVNTAEIVKLNKAVPVTGVPYKMGDVTGKAGLEARWESVLRGINGEEYLEVDAFGRRVRTSKDVTGALQRKPSVPGKNLILTIDQDLQVAAADTFKKMHGDKSIGAVVALNPKTGEVLAFFSQPSFDPTDFSRGVSNKIWGELLNNEYRPLRDRTIQDHYSPGSTFKVITAIAALEEGIIDENSKINCSGSYRLGNRVYNCWKKHGHGAVNVVDAITQSCDVFFYRMGQRLGIDTIAKYANMLGLGRKTGVNLAHEESGLVPTEEWKLRYFGQPWIPGETLSNAIGQSYMLVTPLQLANAYAAIGTGGNIWRPYLVKYIESSDGRILKEYEPELMNKITISKKTLDLVHKGLWGVVNDPHGTTYSHRIPGIEVAGKTGSTQVIGLPASKIKTTKCETMPFLLRDNALFAAYAPPEDPQIAVAVVAEHACHGASGAGPIALQLVKTYLQKYMPERYSDEVIKARLKQGNLIRYVTPPDQEEDEAVAPDHPSRPDVSPSTAPDQTDEDH